LGLPSKKYISGERVEVKVQRVVLVYDLLSYSHHLHFFWNTVWWIGVHGVEEVLRVLLHGGDLIICHVHPFWPVNVSPAKF
jgi:hypothetical protein